MGDILLLSKKDAWSQHAGALAKALLGGRVRWEAGSIGMPLPAGVLEREYAAVISFLSPWIIPQALLDRAKLALNFHPGSCEYPGTGCYNFALYEGAKEFGAVCHHMLARVDTGQVVKESLFPVFPADTVETLKLRTMVSMLQLFHEVLSLLAAGAPLPVHGRQWTRRAFTRKELNALCEITPDMPEAEAKRRILATTYPGYPGAYLLKDGEKHPYPVPPGPAIA